MKPNINLVAVFEQKLEEEEQEFHSGTLDLSVFKKVKGVIQIKLIKGHLLPTSLVGSDPATLENLYMFVEEEPNNRSEGKSSEMNSKMEPNPHKPPSEILKKIGG